MKLTFIKPLLRASAAAVALVLLTLAGCAPAVKPYASKAFRLKEGMKMAILPFDNLSKNTGAGKSIENIVLVEFLKRAPVTIVEPGEVAGALSQERVRIATSIPRETIKALGKRLGADLLMVGVIHDYDIQTSTGMGGTSAVPILSLTLRVMDTATGEIVWAGSTIRRGNDRETVFGIGRVESLSALAEQTASEMAKAFADTLIK